jgi:hypothetical protein
VAANIIQLNKVESKTERHCCKIFRKTEYKWRDPKIPGIIKKII